MVECDGLLLVGILLAMGLFSCDTIVAMLLVVGLATNIAKIIDGVRKILVGILLVVGLVGHDTIIAKLLVVGL